jgi:hypothetical protein
MRNGARRTPELEAVLLRVGMLGSNRGLNLLVEKPCFGQLSSVYHRISRCYDISM